MGPAGAGDVAEADYISLHSTPAIGPTIPPDYCMTNAIDRQIEEMDALAAVQAKRRSKKRAYLCFDEWNVWYRNHEA